MFTDIKREVAACNDRHAVFRIILQITEPLVVLRAFDAQNWTLGELWIAEGQTIVAGSCQASRLSGHAALVELLTANNLHYELLIPSGPAPTERTAVLINDLLNNENKLIEMCKMAALMAPKQVVGQGSGAPSTAQSLRAVGAAPQRNTTEAAAERKQQEISIPPVLRDDDLVARRQADIEAARTHQSIKRLPRVDPPKNALSNDDLSDRRKQELASAAANPVSVTEAKEAPSTPPASVQPASFTAEQQATLKAATTADAPEMANAAARQPTVAPPDANQALYMLSASHTNLKAFSQWRNSVKQAESEAPPPEPAPDTKAFTAVKHHAEKEPIPPLAWLAITLPALALPLMTVVAVSVSMMESRVDSQAAELCNWQVNQAMDQGEPAGYQRPQHAKKAEPKEVDFWTAMGLHPIHSPFRPPEMPRHNVGTSNAGSNRTSSDDTAASNARDEQKAGTAGSDWRPPASKPLPLSALQSSEIQRFMHEGDQLSAKGRLKEAASTYSAALSKYPQHPELRVAAILVYMRLGQYTSARTLCVDGMNTASTQGDYEVFTHLLKNLPASH